MQETLRTDKNLAFSIKYCRQLHMKEYDSLMTGSQISIGLMGL